MGVVVDRYLDVAEITHETFSGILRASQAGYTQPHRQSPAPHLTDLGTENPVARTRKLEEPERSVVHKQNGHVGSEQNGHLKNKGCASYIRPGQRS